MGIKGNWGVYDGNWPPYTANMQIELWFNKAGTSQQRTIPTFTY
jgi:hypothetical protein